MAGIIGIGNALVDIMTRLTSDDILNRLGFPKGSMQLVDKEASDRVLSITEGLEKSIASGGSAANTIHGTARLGLKSGFIGRIGNDEFGQYFKNDMLQSSIEPVLLESNTSSGRAIALVSPDSERTFATYLGAAIELTSNDLKDEYFNGYSILHIEGYLLQNHDLMYSVAAAAKRCGLQVSLDMASFNVVAANLDFLHGFIGEFVDIVFANEEEAKAYTGKEPEEALDIIASQCKLAIVKIGKNGSLIKHGNETVKVGVIKAESIDTTGAGDLYAAGFLFGLTQNKPLDVCGKYGAILSGNVIEVIGAKMNDDRWNEIRKMMVD